MPDVMLGLLLRAAVMAALAQVQSPESKACTWPDPREQAHAADFG